MRQTLITGLVLAATLLFFYCTSDNIEDFTGNINDCDTLQVSYANHIAPVMAASCNACHSAAAPLGGVNTSDFSGLSLVAANGKLKGAVNHQPGFSPMPQGQPKLDSCTLKRINAWINQGFPNN
jgi:mono/diheme cytochrome c family protein